jgi:hypothetical protein
MTPLARRSRWRAALRALPHEKELAVMDTDLESDYQRLRAQLQALQAQAVKDYPRIDQLIDELERLQLAIKERHGLKGNNPNE